MEPETLSSSRSSFSFAMFIFGIFVLIPLVIFSIFAFKTNTEYELKLECLKQGRTHVNGLCVHVSK